MSAGPTAAYTGTANLEVMEAARNYNTFLTAQVMAHARPGAAIVDFGAGTGTFAQRLTMAGYAVRCVELDPVLRHRLAAAGLGVYALTEEVPPASLDYIYSLNVLEHIEDDLGALRELRSRLKPGGRLMLYVPAFQSLYSSMDRLVGHFRRYRRHQLLALLRRAGFEIDGARYCDSLGFFATLAFKAIGNDSGRLNERVVIFYDKFLFPLSRLLDRLLDRLLGKNLLVLARRGGSDSI